MKFNLQCIARLEYDVDRIRLADLHVQNPVMEEREDYMRFFSTKIIYSIVNIFLLNPQDTFNYCWEKYFVLIIKSIFLYSRSTT